MEKIGPILHEIGEESEDSGTVLIFEELNKYYVKPPSSEATAQLIQKLKPILAQETLGEKHEQRFRGIVENSRKDNKISVLLKLVAMQTALISRAFIALTVIFCAGGLMISSVFDANSITFLITVAPFLGILTFFYEYRAQLYNVGELEASCQYSPAQLVVARLLVVLGYNIALCTVATLVVSSAYNMVLWKLILNWLAPLVLILGIALSASLRIGITGGCVTAGILWAAKLTLASGGSFLGFLLPSLTGVVIDTFSILLGIGLIYVSINSLQVERLTQYP